MNNKFIDNAHDISKVLLKAITVGGIVTFIITLAELGLSCVYKKEDLLNNSANSTLEYRHNSIDSIKSHFR